MANKKLTESEIDIIRENLRSSKSAERRRSAKMIRKHSLHLLSDDLYSAYKKEVLDKRTWETQTEMLYAFGAIDYKKALPVIREIVLRNERLDMITFAAALSYVRLSRNCITDTTPIMYLMEFGERSVLCGAMASLAFDSVIPADNEIETIINKMESYSLEKIYVRGVQDPRGYLISAMSLWKTERTTEYLCKYVEDNNLSHKAKEALIGNKSCFEI